MAEPGEENKEKKEEEVPSQEEKIDEQGENLANKLSETPEISGFEGERKEAGEEPAEKILEEYKSLVGEKYAEKMEELEKSPESLDQYRKSLKDAEVENIRCSSDVLTKEENEKNPEDAVTNVKLETERRLASYTKGKPDEQGWYTLDYLQVAYHHEMAVGLGDVLLDPNIRHIEFRQNASDSYTQAAERTIIDGRICFAVNGEYLTSYTDNQFRIMTDEEYEDAQYRAEIVKEREARSAYREQFKQHEAAQIDFNYVESDGAYADLNMKQVSANLDGTLVDQAQNASQRGTSIKNFDDLGQKNKPLSELIRHVCRNFGVPEPLVYATFRMESGFKHGIIGDKHLANTSGVSVGIGQFQEATWKSVTKRKDFLSFMQNVYPGKTSYARGENIMADITATAVKLRKNSSDGGINLSQKISTENLFYLRGRYTGFPFGKKKYMEYARAFAANRTMPTIPEHNKTFKRYVNFVNHVRKFEHQYTNTPLVTRSISTNELDNEYVEEISKKAGYPPHFVMSYGIAKSGCPGFYQGVGKGRNEVHKKEVARNQMLNLKSMGISKIYNCTGEGKRNAGVAESVGMGHENILMHKDNFLSKHSQFRRIAKTSGKILFNCRNGAHRAPAAKFAILVIRGQVPSMEKGLKMAGTHYKKYKNYRTTMFRDMLRFAKHYNVPIEDKLLKYAGISYNDLAPI